MFTNAELSAMIKLLINEYVPPESYNAIRSAIAKMEKELARREALTAERTCGK